MWLFFYLLASWYIKIWSIIYHLIKFETDYHFEQLIDRLFWQIIDYLIIQVIVFYMIS